MPAYGNPAPVQARSDGANGSPGNASLRTLLPRAASEASELVRKDLELAKVETKEQMALAGKAGAMFTGTAVFGFFALQLLSLAAAWGLSAVMPRALAFLIVGVVYLAIAGATFARARKLAAGVSLVPQQALQSVKEDAQWLRARLK